MVLRLLVVDAEPVIAVPVSARPTAGVFKWLTVVLVTGSLLLDLPPLPGLLPLLPRPLALGVRLVLERMGDSLSVCVCVYI